MLAAAEEDVDSAALVAQVPVLPVGEAGLRQLAVLVVARGAEEAVEELVELLSRRSFSAAMARSSP